MYVYLTLLLLTCTWIYSCRSEFYTCIDDKPDDSYFHITTVSFPSSNIAYGVFTSYHIQYARACSLFIIWSYPLMNVTWHTVAWPYSMTTLHRSDFIPNRDLITELDIDGIMRGFHRAFAMGMTCRQVTLTPSDFWSRSFWMICLVLTSKMPQYFENLDPPLICYQYKKTY